MTHIGIIAVRVDSADGSDNILVLSAELHVMPLWRYEVHELPRWRLSAIDVAATLALSAE